MDTNMNGLPSQDKLLEIVDTIERITLALAKDILSKLWKKLLQWIAETLKVLNTDVAVLYSGIKLYVQKGASICRRLVRDYYNKAGQWYVKEREDKVRFNDIPEEIRNNMGSDLYDATDILKNELY